VINQDGSYPKNASGFMLLNRTRLGDEVAFKQDLIHEFFHVLQYAHNVAATHDHGLDHWFTEATATWAETFYDRPHSSVPHAWFTDDFQTSVAGLEVQDPDHEYAAYIWPFFMEQEANESAVFNAWAAIDGVAAADFKGVTAAVSAQLPFKEHFVDFALRNLNMAEVLTSAGEKPYTALDPQFPDGVAPTNMTSGRLTPGEPYVSSAGGPPPLGAAYYQFGIDTDVKQVTLSIVNMSPTEAVEGAALLHHGSGNWQTQTLEGGEFKFCRDEDAWKDVDRLYLVVSDHSPDVPILGFLEASAKESCEEVLELVGDLTWQYQVKVLGPPEEFTHTSNGQAHIHVLWNPPFGWQTQNDSTYSFDYSISNCSPGSSFAGRLESSVEPKEPSEGVGISHIQGAPRQDIPINLALVGTWTAACTYAGLTGEPGPTVTSYEFPFCSTGGVTALFDGKDSYVVNCFPGGEGLGPGSELSGQVSGTLHTGATRTPAP